MPSKRKSKSKSKIAPPKMYKRKSKNKKGTSKNKVVQKGGKRKMNEYFKLMNNARKNDLSSFQYKGSTYTQFTAKTGLKMYKKA